MNKKKIQALLVAGLLSVGIVGGSLAWFTSQDSVKNIFETGKSDDNKVDAGIDVLEKFDDDDEYKSDIVDKAKNPVLPGDTIKKQVKVASTSNYDQFVRAKFTKVWYAPNSMIDGKEDKHGTSKVTHYRSELVKNDEGILVEKYFYTDNPTDEEWKELDFNKIKLNLADELIWTKGNNDDYYYYNYVLKYNNDKDMADETSDLLSSVTFVQGENDNIYKNLTFNVIVEAEGIQASHGAAEASDWSTEVPAAKLDGYMNEK